MKKILASIIVLMGVFCVGSALAYISPGKPVGHINDYTGTLSEDTKTRLEAFLYDLKNAGKSEVAVAIVPTLAGDSIEEYSVTLAREWGIGSRESSNGVLLLVVKDDRELRIEVGYGLEGDLTDLKSHRIIDEVIIPRFKEGDYDGGVEDGVREIVGVIAPGFVGSTQKVDYSTDPTSQGFDIAPFILIGFFIISAVLGSSKSWWGGGVLGGAFGLVAALFIGFWYWGLVVMVGLVLLGLIFDYLVSRGGSGGARPPWFTGGSSGSSSGGFGGFGGGSFGGGGSSGKW